MKKLFAFIIALMMLVPVCAVAEHSDWICPECGQAGNTGNFCYNCGTARPSADWTCPNCGQTGNTGNFCSNCGTGKTDAGGASGETAAEVTAVNEDLEQIPGETDRVKVIVRKTDASSYIVNKQAPDRWKPDNAIDGNKTTCWQFSSKKGLKSKAWIDLIFTDPQTVDELWFMNGFQGFNDKGISQYGINSRPKKVVVKFLISGETKYRDAQELTLRDEYDTGWQQHSVGRHENVTAVRIEIHSIYKASEAKFQKDVCLSEVMPVQIAPAAGAMPAQGEQTAVVYESRPDITGCSLKMKLATRTGPGTEYAEPGTFFSDNWQNQTVKVLKKSFDGSIWWVQVDFQNGSKGRYRVWTGAEKRVNVDLNQVKEEKRICDCDIYPTTDTWYGPGGSYQKSKITINRSAVGTIYQMENGYVDVKYWYEDDGFDGNHRIWLPESAVYNLYYGDYSGE